MNAKRGQWQQAYHAGRRHDCASCVAKIETALQRMPGVSDFQLNFAAEKLELTLSSDSATRKSVLAQT
ncbi:cation transporter [Advenella sp. WQ 585]|uniref:Cation transporter n=1 Tax=Advenella mandrilli TaxID=2800330 RepID=A0ABS1EA11_9BURK|nr:cation transporter [Advenella mandrilli]